MCSSDLPPFFTDHFSLRQRPCFLYCPFLGAAALRFFIAQFSLRQRPLFLSCPFFGAAAPPLFILTNFRCGSAPLFILPGFRCGRSEEHTSELQSPDHLVCRLLLEKKKTKNIREIPTRMIWAIETRKRLTSVVNTS